MVSKNTNEKERNTGNKRRFADSVISQCQQTTIHQETLCVLQMRCCYKRVVRMEEGTNIVNEQLHGWSEYAGLLR